MIHKPRPKFGYNAEEYAVEEQRKLDEWIEQFCKDPEAIEHFGARS